MIEVKKISSEGKEIKQPVIIEDPNIFKGHDIHYVLWNFESNPDRIKNLKTLILKYQKGKSKCLGK